MGASLLTPSNVSAQEVVVEEEDVVVGEVDCQTKYYTTWRDNWFIEIGAGVSVPFVENFLDNGRDAKRHVTAAYNIGFGRRWSPYFTWRASLTGGSLHWDTGVYSRAQYVSGNLDIMWDMFNSINLNPKRVFSLMPFLGIGTTYVWNFKTPTANDMRSSGSPKTNQWMFPVSAGIQARFRLCKYADFFVEGRCQVYGDNFNNYVGGRSMDINVTGIAGFNIYIGGSDFREYDPCANSAYLADLNNQVNDLRSQLATTGAALAAAQAQLPCPEVVEQETVVETSTLLTTVRFKINSAKISDEQMVNVYNIAQWMKANPEQKVLIQGYADKDTGTSAYNMKLSERRAKAIYDTLVNTYGISPDRLTTTASGSDVQPYETNNWNRIVIFAPEL